MNHKYYLEMSNISKSFPAVKILDNIELNIKRGEIRALMGENGAGKSTLIKILGGIYSMDPTGGKIRIDGQDAHISNVHDARRYGVGIIHQEISLANNMSVADNLFMGREIQSGPLLDDREMVRRSQDILDKMGLEADARDLVRNLSIAKQQMVEICRTLLSNAKIIVMDEPTSSLTQTEIDQLFAQIEKLKRQGITIIYISHRMDEIFKVADSVSVLRDGKMIGTDSVENLTQAKIINMMVGRELSEVYKRGEAPKIGGVSLEVRNFKNKRLKDVSFSVRSGEIVGLAGLVGAGRTELARAVFGIDKIESGEMRVKGRRVAVKCPEDALGLGIGYVPEDRKTEGLFLIHSIKYNSSITVVDKFIRLVGANRKYENELVKNYTEKLSIKMTSPGQKVRLLSGGNQQKVVLASRMAADPDIFILDEPTRGVDIGAKAEIYRIIFGLAREGKAVVLISSEMEEIINLSDRIVVMYEGAVTGELANSGESRLKQEQIMWLASGGEENEDNE